MGYESVTNLAIVYSRAQNGIEAPLVRVEVHLSRGLPRLSILDNIKPT
jgi:magnesium chelatase family protein